MATPKTLPVSQRSWIDRIVEAHKVMEAPPRYYWWAAASAISSVIRKQIFIQRGFYKLYPNLYVVLMSKNAGLRKSGPINMVKRMLYDLNCTRIISGRNTIQAITTDLSKQITLPGGRVIAEAQATVMSQEFCDMLNEPDLALTRLVDWFDTDNNKQWSAETKNGGKETLKEVCINLLVASNQTYFDATVNDKNKRGGFVSRTLVVFESELNTINPLTGQMPLIDIDGLRNELAEIGNSKGEFRWSQRAKEFYDPWYEDLMRNRAKNDTHGILNRLGDMVVKVAMVMNLARDRDMVIHRDNIEQAIDKCEECLPGATRVIKASQDMTEAGVKDLVLEVLLEAGPDGIRKDKLGRELNKEHAVTSSALNEVVLTLLENDCLTISRTKGDRYDTLSLTEKAKELYKDFRRL